MLERTALWLLSSPTPPTVPTLQCGQTTPVVNLAVWLRTVLLTIYAAVSIRATVAALIAVMTMCAPGASSKVTPSPSALRARQKPGPALTMPKWEVLHRNTFPLGEVNDLLHNSGTYDTVHPARLYSQPIVHVILSSYSLLYHLTTAATMNTMSNMTHLITYLTPAATLKDPFVKVGVPSRSPSPSP